MPTTIRKINPWAGLVILCLSLGAAGLTAFLAWHAGGDVPGCGSEDGFGCADVLTTRWSRWFGLPVSAAGLMVYAAIAITTLGLLIRPSQSSWGRLAALAVMAAGAASWFTALQVFEVEAYCVYCLLTHTAGLAIAIIAAAQILQRTQGTARTLLSACGGGLAVAALVLGQLYPRYELRLTRVGPAPDRPVQAGGDPSPPAYAPRNDSDSAKARRVLLVDGKLEMTLGEYPILGSTGAPHIIALLTDYTCPACRKMHAELIKEQRRMNGIFSIVIFPMPLDAQCNPGIAKTSYGHRNACLFAKMALALWGTAPEAFPAYDAALFEPQFPPTRNDVVKLVDGLVGAQALDKAMADPLYEKMLQFSMSLFYSPLVERKVLPVLLTPKGVRLGNPDSAEDLHQFLQENLGLAPEMPVE